MEHGRQANGDRIDCGAMRILPAWLHEQHHNFGQQARSLFDEPGCRIRLASGGEPGPGGAISPLEYVRIED